MTMGNEFHTLFYSFHFYLFGLIALASAILFVTRKSPVAAAMWLVNVMFCLAALYVMLGAEFIGAIQVLVYAGAIMVVFLFVVMLLNLGHPEEIADMRKQGWRLTAGFVGLLLLAEVMVLANTQFPDALIERAANAPPPVATGSGGGVIAPIAEPLFREYLLAFELTSMLLLTAIVGAVVIGKKRGAADAR
jgi:NADH-quinone oxidoreductase subunit J